MNLENEIKNDIKIENNQDKFLDTFLGKTINGAIDIGLRTILPDLIENQIIDIKNALLMNGLTEGIETAVKSAVNFAKSAAGIITGNFQNIDQIKIATDSGGIIDTISNVLDYSLDKIYHKGIINSTVNSIIKQGKNTVLNTVSTNIKKEMKQQDNLINNLENSIELWKNAYNNKDLNLMNKIYEKIEKNINKIVPLENLIKDVRKIENIHNFIKNRGNNIEITELENDLIEKFSN